MDSRLYELANRQADVVATWQLVAAGWSRKKVKHHAREWRRIHPGVYVLTSSRLTRHQLWFAAALTRPDTVLGVGSAGAAYGFTALSAATKW